MPFTGTDEIHMRAPTCKYADSKSGFNDMVGIESRYRQGNLAVFFILGIRFTELFPAEQPLREGARQRRRMDPRGGLKTNVKRSISRACHFERSERSLPFAVRDSRFPHMCRALLRFSHLSFIPLEPYPARFARHLPHAGKALSVVILFPHMRVFALRLWGKRYSRIVAFPMGEGLRYGIYFSFICFHAPESFCFLPSHSPVFPSASKISRFARNDDTGKALLSFR